MIDQQWLAFNKPDLKVEAEQLQDEGAALPGELAVELKALLEHKGPEDRAYRERVRRLLIQTAHLPTKPGFPHDEPSDLAAIQAARPAISNSVEKPDLSEKDYYNRVYGAWLGRCSGCLLGIPIEGLFVKDFWPYLQEIGQYPLNSYLDSSIPDELKEKYTFITERGYIDEIDHMVENDDTNYTVISLAVLEKYGWDFKPENVAAFWLDNLPAYHTFTAERVAYRNFLLMKDPPESASYGNPFREWIGAQIRGDFWGYVCPGDPARAAALAWRDACISHVKNGIYGEMWVAAMCSAAAVLTTPRQVLEAGLAQVPKNSRLTTAVREVMDWYDTGKDVQEAILLIHQRWDDTNPHHWCHTLSNAQIVTLGLLWGDNDYEKSISWAVTAGIDTDCNGATVGSVIGMLHGADRLPANWMDPLNDRLDTGISGYHQVNISDMAQLTVELAKQGGFTPTD